MYRICMLEKEKNRQDQVLQQTTLTIRALHHKSYATRIEALGDQYQALTVYYEKLLRRILDLRALGLSHEEKAFSQEMQRLATTLKEKKHYLDQVMTRPLIAPRVCMRYK